MKTLLVTGAATGLGAALIAQASAEGHRVIAVDRDAVPELPGVTFLRCDLRDVDQVLELARDVVARFAPLDAVIHNACVGGLNPFVEAGTAHVVDTIAVNVTAPLVLTQALLPSMIARGAGRIVNISSLAAALTAPGTAAYAGSKAALERFTENVSGELASTGIRVGFVRIGRMRSPSFIDVMARLHRDLDAGRFARNRPMEHALRGVVGDTRGGMDPADVAREVLAFTWSTRRRGTVAPLSERLGITIGARLPASLFYVLLRLMGRSAPSR
jgi:NAD(P)-dependent dehydrogenase (short-subunit alcohol dehydrogenase family)